MLTALLLAAEAVSLVGTELTVRWLPSDPPAVAYEVCITEHPSERRTCAITTAPTATFELGTAWRRLSIEATGLNEDGVEGPASPVWGDFGWNEHPSDATGDGAVGIPDFLLLSPAFGEAVGQPGRPEIVVEP